MKFNKPSTPFSSPISRGLAAVSIAAVGAGLLAFATPTPMLAATTNTPRTAEDRSIRPFKVQIPQAALDDLRRRINATRWPDKETVADRSQGAQLADLQELLRYW